MVKKFKYLQDQTLQGKKIGTAYMVQKFKYLHEQALPGQKLAHLYGPKMKYQDQALQVKSW